MSGEDLYDFATTTIVALLFAGVVVLIAPFATVSSSQKACIEACGAGRVRALPMGPSEACVCVPRCDDRQERRDQ